MTIQERNNLIKVSKFLSLVLRHDPGRIQAFMDRNGWVKVDELVQKTHRYGGLPLTREIIKQVVENDLKKRFSFSEDGSKIRANQGHSLDVDVELEKTEPPHMLYHGTAFRNLWSIFKEGIKPMSRQYVHLSYDRDIALETGKRHGKPVVLSINTQKMYEDKFIFYLSENNVWLTKEIPIKYVILPL